MTGKNHTIVLDVVGLEYEHIADGHLPNLAKLSESGEISKLEPVFPAVTCTVQASLLSGKYPKEHGIISNGLYDRDTYTVAFWEQASKLVHSDRIWDIVKKQNPSLTTAALFLQNTMYAASDIVVTPRPIHTDSGMIMWCYSKPVGYYEELKQKFGEFNLAKYWGPLSSFESSDWICRSIEYTIEKHRPNFLCAYIPHIDYSAQRFGPNSNQVSDDLKKADNIIGNIVQKTVDAGIRDKTRFVILSEYAFNKVTNAVPINVKLRDAGLVSTRTIGGKEYLDFEFSKAFAMVDHQIAHIYVKDRLSDQVRKIVEEIDGVDRVLHTEDQKNALGINHPRSGDLIAISERDKWFSYYWWYDSEKAPDFATKVDIHRKPGYDPVELFFDPKTRGIPLDAELVKGSHGRPFNSSTGEGYATLITDFKTNTEGGTTKCTDIAKMIIGN